MPLNLDAKALSGIKFYQSTDRIIYPWGLNPMPSGQNPWNQILNAKRRRGRGDLSKLQQRLWHAINCCMIGIDDDLAGDDPEGARKWINSLTQVSNVYARVVIDSDIEQRIRTLEQQLTASQG